MHVYIYTCLSVHSGVGAIPDYTILTYIHPYIHTYIHTCTHSRNSSQSVHSGIGAVPRVLRRLPRPRLLAIYFHTRSRAFSRGPPKTVRKCGAIQISQGIIRCCILYVFVHMVRLCACVFVCCDVVIGWWISSMRVHGKNIMLGSNACFF